jgi:hypothetical protein
VNFGSSADLFDLLWRRLDQPVSLGQQLTVLSGFAVHLALHQDEIFEESSIQSQLKHLRFFLLAFLLRKVKFQLDLTHLDNIVCF